MKEKNLGKYLFWSERWLGLCSILFSLSVCLSQFFLCQEDTRAVFTKVEDYEGTRIESIQEALGYGELTLQLKGIRPTDRIAVLINGKTEAVFSKPTLVIPVLEHSYVEISGLHVEEPFTVRVISVSDCVDAGNLEMSVTVEGNIVPLGRIAFVK